MRNLTSAVDPLRGFNIYSDVLYLSKRCQMIRRSSRPIGRQSSELLNGQIVYLKLALGDCLAITYRLIQTMFEC